MKWTHDIQHPWYTRDPLPLVALRFFLATKGNDVDVFPGNVEGGLVVTDEFLAKGAAVGAFPEPSLKVLS